MAGTLVLTDTIGQTFNDLFAGVYKGTDAVVRATAVFTGPQFTGDQRPFVSASLASTLSRVPGVAAAEGSVFGYARLIGKNGKALGNPASGAPTLGGNWNQVAALNPWHLVAGHAPQAADQVVIDKKSATDGHLRVGDTTTVLVKGPPQRVQVVGVIAFGTADSPGGASVVLFTTPGRAAARRRAGEVHQHLVRRQARRLAAAAGQQPPPGAAARHRGDHRGGGDQGDAETSSPRPWPSSTPSC